MNHIPALVTSCSLVVALFVGLSPGAQAQTATVTYDLENVWLRPDITHPWAAARQMTGTFVWTYTVGDFDNGTGQFTSYQIPWWARTTPTLRSTVETDSIEFTMEGNYHGLGLDLGLRLAPPLSIYHPSPIDTARSSFDIEVNTTYKGHIISGSIVPRCPPPYNYGTGTAGSGGLVPRITHSGGAPRVGNASFRVDCDQILGAARCALLLGTDKAQVQILGVGVLVEPSTWVVIPGQANGTAGVAGAGAVQTAIPIPNDSLLLGTEFDFQLIAIDPGASQGMAAATDGLSLVVCL